MTQEQIVALRGRLRNLKATRGSLSALYASYLIADAVITCAAVLGDILEVLETGLLARPGQAARLIER